LKLYQSPSANQKFMLGHSIGGLIAKALFTDPEFDPYKVHTIITLATPHTPVIVMDRYTREFYSKIDAFWEDQRKTNLSHVTMYSIGGGSRDIQVRSGLTTSASADLNVITTAAPGVWVSTDHQCIVWCKQLVLALNRALFDCINPLTHQMTLNKEHRKEVFAYHLHQRSGGKRFKAKEQHPVTMRFDKDGYWSDILKRQFVFTRSNVTCNHTYVMIKVLDDPKHRWLTLESRPNC